MVSWVQALKEYAKQHGGKYVVPKKGTPEYDAVKKLMGASAPAPAKEALKEAKKEAKKEGDGTKKGMPRKTARKAFEDLPPRSEASKSKSKKSDGMEAMKSLEADAAPKKKVRRSKKVLKEAGGVTFQADAASRNPEVLLNNATNLHEPIAPPAALAGDLAELKKDVARVRKPKSLPKLIEPERVVSDEPFSFSALKKRIYGN